MNTSSQNNHHDPFYEEKRRAHQLVNLSTKRPLTIDEGKELWAIIKKFHYFIER